MSNNQQEQDKKLLECFKKVILPPYNYKHELGCKSCPKTHINWCNVQNLLAAQARISYAEGVEAERKRAADILEACQKRIKQSEQVWSLQTYYEVQSELDGCKFDILTPPTNEKQ